MEKMRLNKYLSTVGFCSRREADRLAENGRVFIDGRQAAPGDMVEEGSRVEVNGKNVVQERPAKPVLLVLNKPRGVVCTTTENDRAMNVVELVDYKERVYPVGRLDKDSEGLLLLTNQGELANKIIHAGSMHEKEYLVTVSAPYNAAFLKKMREGVFLKDLGEKTRPCRVEAVGEKQFRITLTQGLNRQIRRMCGELGYVVTELKRERVMNLRLGRLKPGDFRRVTPAEYEELISLL